MSNETKTLSAETLGNKLLQRENHQRLSGQMTGGAYSRPRLPLIPDEACHPFHAKAATDSTAKLPPWQAA